MQAHSPDCRAQQPVWRALPHSRPLPSGMKVRPGVHKQTADRTSRMTLQSAEHSRYVMEVGVANRPESIETLLEVLKAQGQEVVAPDQRLGLHPLAIPLTCGPAPESREPDAAVTGGTVYTCLLRWPASAATKGLPVVRMSKGAPAVSLLARSSEEYLRRALAEEDVSSGPGPIAAAVGPPVGDIYVSGSVAASRLPSLGAWLTRNGSMFPDVVESLVTSHLDKGDHMSAMITGEWYMKRAHFAGWARPYEFNAQLYSRLQRAEEARDSARVALHMPWWTLRAGFEAAARLAQLPADAAAVHRQLSEATKANKGGPLPAGIGVVSMTDEQIAIEEAGKLMNGVAAGEAQWDDIRSELADKYTLGGQRAVADFIRAAG